MHRWMGIISDSDGLDAVLQLADDPDISNKMREMRKNAKERARIAHALETGRAPTNSHDIKKITDQYIKSGEAELIKQAGGADIRQYEGYNLRKRFVSGNILELSWLATKEDMNKIRSKNPYQGALSVLQLVSSGLGKIVTKGMDEDDLEDYIDIMRMQVKKESRRKGR